MFLQGRIGRICAAILAGVFASAISASAFTNLSIINSGSSLATPSLSQVTAVGASTAVESTFNGGLLFSNATGTGGLVIGGNVSSTNLTSGKLTFNTDAVASAPNITGLDSDTGILFASNGTTLTFARNGSDRIQLNANLTFQNGFDIACSSSASGCDVGTPGGSMGSIYASGTVQAGNATSSFLAGAGTAPLPAYSFIGDPDTGFYTSAPNNIVTSLAGTAITTWTSGTFRATSNNVTSLGTAAVSWSDIYASGTANLATINAVTSTFTSTSTHNGISNTGLMAVDGGVDFVSPTGTSFLAALPTTGAGNLGFLFNSTNDVTTASVFTIQDNGTSRFSVNGSGVSTMSAATVAGTFIANGTATLASVTSSGAVVDFPGIGAPIAASDFACWTSTGLGRMTHQTANCTFSTARFKKHIQSMKPEEMLEKTLALRSVSFDWVEKMVPDHGINGGGKESTGFIAEEVALIDPMLVVYTDEYTPDDLAFVEKNYPGAVLKKGDKKLIPSTVDYARVSVYTTGAIQAQQAQIDELRSLTSGVESNKQSFYERLIKFFSGLFN